MTFRENERSKKKIEELYKKQNQKTTMERRKSLDRYNQYLRFTKEVDSFKSYKEDEISSTFSKDNALMDGSYLHRGINIIIENDQLSGFVIKEDRRKTLFTIFINDGMDNLQLYRIVNDMIHNLFNQGDL